MNEREEGRKKTMEDDIGLGIRQRKMKTRAVASFCWARLNAYTAWQVNPCSNIRNSILGLNGQPYVLYSSCQVATARQQYVHQ